MQTAEKYKINTVAVYVCNSARFAGFDALPAYMKERIKSITAAKTITQKRCAYGLLAYAIKERFGMPWLEDTTYLSPTGKPLANDYYFSISHTQDIVAVAVHESPVGVDVESTNRQISREVFSRMLHQQEKMNSSLPPAICVFTQKEAIFKKQGKEKAFIPAKINTTGERTKTIEFSYEGQPYLLTVAADELQEIDLCVLS